MLSLYPTRVRRGGLACKCSMPYSVVTAGELSGDCQEEELESEKLEVRSSNVGKLGRVFHMMDCLDTREAHCYVVNVTLFQLAMPF